MFDLGRAALAACKDIVIAVHLNVQAVALQLVGELRAVISGNDAIGPSDVNGIVERKHTGAVFLELCTNLDAELLEHGHVVFTHGVGAVHAQERPIAGLCRALAGLAAIVSRAALLLKGVEHTGNVERHHAVFQRAFVLVAALLECERFTVQLPCAAEFLTHDADVRLVLGLQLDPFVFRADLNTINRTRYALIAAERGIVLATLAAEQQHQRHNKHDHRGRDADDQADLFPAAGLFLLRRFRRSFGRHIRAASTGLCGRGICLYRRRVGLLRSLIALLYRWGIALLRSLIALLYGWGVALLRRRFIGRLYRLSGCGLLHCYLLAAFGAELRPVRNLRAAVSAKTHIVSSFKFFFCV